MLKSDAAKEEYQAHILLDLFKQNLKDTLVKDAMAAIRPTIDAKVDLIVAELEPEIQKAYDLYKDETVLRFVVNRRGEVT